jgi:hypothetical protein
MEKHRWGEYHLVQLQNRIREFLASDPVTVTQQDDPNGLVYRFVVTKTEDVPQDIPLIAGDAVHNLRATLDHLAYCLATKPSSSTYFPLRVTQPKSGTIKIEGCADPAINQVVDSIQPYQRNRPRVETMLRLLHEWDIIDKHRLLLTTVATPDGAAHSINTGATGDGIIDYDWGDLHLGRVVATVRFTAPKVSFSPQFRLNTTVAVAEGPTEFDLVHTVWRMKQEVAQVVNQFQQFL